MSEKPKKSELSEFRDFTIPNLCNTLQGASYQHEIGNHDLAEFFLRQAQDKLNICIEQNQKDKQAKEGIKDDTPNQ
ncbi:MAG: hypothetical protein WA865_04065 [Spirulinaceae cyanobacterium]